MWLRRPRRGFRTIIDNRPDAEDAGQPSAAEMDAIAQRHGLGSVEIHLELMTAVASWIMAVKLWSVLSARMAMRLNSLSLQKKFSIKWRDL